jgi:hypothetical protein
MPIQLVMLSLTVPEVEVVLRALGTQPLHQVAQVYGKIQTQAQEQLADTDKSPPSPEAAQANGVAEPVLSKPRKLKAAPPAQ